MRRSLEQALSEAKSCTPAELPYLLADLELIRVTATARLNSPVIESRPDMLLTVTEAAARMNLSKNYLYRHSRRLPFTRRVGRALRFSSAGLDNYLRKSR